MNMFFHELKAGRKSMIIWACSLSAIVILMMSIFPAFMTDVEAAKKLFLGLPDAVKKMFGFYADTFFTLLGFYAYIFLFVVLCGSIQAMNLGTGIVSKEVSGKTADFLLSKPVSRKRILTAKLLAALAIMIITDAVFFIVAVIMANIVKTEPFSMAKFIMISLTLLFVQLMFFTLGFLISVIAPKIRSVLPISLGVVFTFFLLNMVDSIIGEKAARYIIPFLYYDNSYIIRNGSYEVSFMIVEAVFIIVAIAASYRFYIRKDIKV